MSWESDEAKSNSFGTLSWGTPSITINGLLFPMELKPRITICEPEPGSPEALMISKPETLP